MFTIEDLLEATSREALAEHDKNVRDTSTTYAGDIAAIQAYYEEIGWAKIIASNGKSKIYSEADKDYWCGVFVAAMMSDLNAQLDCEGEPEIGLHPKLAYYVFPSTSRMNDPKKWELAGFKKPDLIDPKDIKFGDIVSITTGERKEYGDHITFALSSVHASGTFETVEGNAIGLLGDGTRAEGVVKCRRHVRVVQRVYRLTKKHFIGVD